MSTSATRKAAAGAIDLRDVLSDDGTRLQAWSNDPEGDKTGPTVLLCNGLGASPFMWPALLRPECQVRVVSWNHRGTGGSARPADPTRVCVEEFVDDALSVMDHFALGRSVVVGWSQGVGTMVELALRHPERVSGLFAVAGVPGDTFSAMLAPLHLPHPVARAVTITVCRALCAAGRAITPVTTRVPVGGRVVDALARTGLMLPVPDPELAAVALAELLAVPVEWYTRLALTTSRHARVSLHDLQVPVELVFGTRDLVTGARDLAATARRIDGATYVELHGTHFLPLEQPDRLHRLLLDFLARVGEP